MKIMMLLGLFTILNAAHNNTEDQVILDEIRREREVTDHILKERLRVTERQLDLIHKRLWEYGCPECMMDAADQIQSDKRALKNVIEKMNRN